MSAGNLLLFDHWDMSLRETVTSQYVINGANQVECIDTDGSGECSGTGTETLWGYDAYGNLRNDGEMTYQYDAAGRLIETIFEGNKTTYVYNGDGERVSQAVDYYNILRYDTTTYILDVAASALLSETTTTTGDPPGTSTTHFLNGLAPIAQSDGTTTAYFLYDGAGSVRQFANASGSVLSAQTFDPYGNPYPEPGTDASTYGFGGGVQDSNGLVYSNGQYYNPTQGRMLRQHINLAHRVLSIFQTYRDISQARHIMQPMLTPRFASPDFRDWEKRLSVPLALMNPSRIMADAYDAYRAGERRPWAFAANKIGLTDSLITSTNFLNQWQADSRVVWRPGYRWYDRLPAATRIGATAVGTADAFAGIYFLAKNAIISARIARNNAWAAERFAYLDEYLGAGEAGGLTLRQTIAQDRAFRRLYAKARWASAEDMAWQYADEAAMGIGGGPGLTDVDYAEMAIEYVKEANRLRREAGLCWYNKKQHRFGGDTTTFGFGSSHKENSGALIDYLAGTNNFPIEKDPEGYWTRLWKRADQKLKPTVRDYVHEQYRHDVVWIGGEQVGGENLIIGGKKLAPELHLEYIMTHSKGLPPNSRIAYGIANTICDACTSMMTGLGGQQMSSGVWRVPLDNGTVIFFAGR